ncbi:MAG: SPOR domain-containing protein [Nitrospinota bacterium]
MRGLRQPPPIRTIFPSRSGSLGIFAVLLLVVSCAGPPPAEQQETVQPQPPPLPSLEQLQAKLRDLEDRQDRLLQRRAELQEEFGRLTQAHGDLVALRQEVQAARREAAERAASLGAVEAEALGAQKIARAPVARPPTPGGPGAEPYVVHTSSYRNPQSALRETKRLAAKGYVAYMSTADLGRKGIWYRSLVDRFASAEEARSFARRLKERNRLSYAAPMRLPFTVDLEAFTTMDEAREAKAGLEREGLHPYVVKETDTDGSTLYRLRLGAFAKRSEAEAVAERADRAGVASAVVTP